MATLELPPRRSRRTQEMTIQRNRSSLEILVQMGFPKHRAERALASTGDKGVQLASDWLLSHVNDPTLDDKVPRDYILYLCPVGQLQQEFLDFWQKSYQECGWNRAHNYFPHITLCSFFQADDSLVSQLSHAIKKVAERVIDAPETVEFDYFSSTNFIGLFITESFAQMLKQITTDFAEEMKKAGVTVEPHKKQLHVSLAYQFPTDKKEKLETLAKTINLKAPARWDLRLYSRDRGKANCQVRKVLYTHVPGAPDELEMCDGDFIYMNESELETSTDGWYLGTSWMTGCVGMFPGIYTERTAETETWTMHRSIPIVGTDLILKSEQNGPQPGDNIGISPQMLRTGLLSGDHSYATYVNNFGSHFSKSPSQRLLPSDASSLVVNLDGSRAERRLVSMPSSSLTVIPESTVAPTLSGPTVTAGGSSSSGATKSTVQAPKPVVHPSSHANRPPAAVSSQHATPQPLASGGTTTGNAPPTAAVVVGPFQDGRSSSPKHTNRMQAIDNIAPMATIGTKGPRQLYVVRHGERIDFTFGKDWIQNSFNQAGKNPTNLKTHISHNHAEVHIQLNAKEDKNKKTQSQTQSKRKVEDMDSPSIQTLDHPGSERRIVYPALAPVAEDLLSAPASQAYVERIFSLCGLLTAGRRNRMSKSLEMRAFLKLNGKYIRYDLNMPKSVPKRKCGPQDFKDDSPLTVQGHFQARLLGEAMREKEIVIGHVYSSPSLRCVETASSLLEGLNVNLEINVEYGLFEWVGWYQNGIPKFMSLQELHAAGHAVNLNHNPIWPLAKYNIQETAEQFYDRCYQVTKEILKRHESEGGSVLIVSHGINLDTCTRQLVGQPPRSHAGFHEILHKIPYCAMSVAQEATVVRDTWYLIEPPVLPFAHTNNPKYNWTTLTTPSVL